MDISNVGVASGYQYQSKTTSNLQEEVRNTPDSEKRDLGVIVEISKDSRKAQLGLKVSQLSYVCKEIGLSDEAAEQITSTYGKQAEEKINWVNSTLEFMAKQVKIEQEKFYKEHGTPNYVDNVEELRKRNKGVSGKGSVELNMEANSDIYKMFSNLDVNSKENFMNSFAKAVDNFKNYYAGGEVQIFKGTDREQAQLDELVKRFHSLLEA